MKPADPLAAVTLNATDNKPTVVPASTAQDGSALFDNIKSHVPNIVGNTLTQNLLNKINEKESKKIENKEFAECTPKYFPADFKTELMTCGKDQQKQLEEYLNNALSSLQDFSKLVHSASDRLKKCKEIREDYNKKEEEKALTATTTTPKPGKKKPGKATQIFKGIGHAAGEVNKFFEKNGCFIAVGGELVIDTALIAFDLITSTQMGLNTYNTAELTIDTCITKKMDKWMIDNCQKYVPDLGSKRRRRHISSLF